MVFRRKLKNQKGFSLAETLLAVLILLLVSLIVANGLPAARSAYTNAVLGANARSLLSTTVSALRDELGTTWGDVEVDDDNTEVTYYSADTGNRSKLKNGDNGTIVITEYVSTDGLNTGEGVGEPRDLISVETLAKDLSVSYENVYYTVNKYIPTVYDEGYGVIEFTNIQVTPKNNSNHVIAKMDSLKIRVGGVSPTPTPQAHA